MVAGVAATRKILRNIRGAEQVLEFALEMVCEVIEVDNFGVRLEDEQGSYPFLRNLGNHCLHATEDCADAFIGSREDPTLRGLCGRVLRGKPFDSPARFTAFGSYFRMDMPLVCARDGDTSPSASTSCDGFSSLALIPLRDNDSIQGLLHLADERRSAFGMNELRKAERLARAAVELCHTLTALDAKANRSAMHVLLVEDDATLRPLVARVLRSCGYRVSTAEHGAEAWRQIQLSRFHVIITDIVMPVMSGIELIRRVRDHFGPYGPRIMVYSADLAPLTTELMRRYTIEAAFTKPVDWNEVDARIAAQPTP